jgi:hypothetical protein
VHHPQVPLFGPLTPSQRSQLCTALKPLHARAGTLIVQAGDVGNTFYVVEAGTCVVQGASGQVCLGAPVLYYLVVGCMPAAGVHCFPP